MKYAVYPIPSLYSLLATEQHFLVADDFIWRVDGVDKLTVDYTSAVNNSSLTDDPELCGYADLMISGSESQTHKLVNSFSARRMANRSNPPLNYFNPLAVFGLTCGVSDYEGGAKYGEVTGVNSRIPAISLLSQTGLEVGDIGLIKCMSTLNPNTNVQGLVFKFDPAKHNTVQFSLKTSDNATDFVDDGSRRYDIILEFGDCAQANTALEGQPRMRITEYTRSLGSWVTGATTTEYGSWDYMGAPRYAENVDYQESMNLASYEVKANTPYHSDVRSPRSDRGAGNADWIPRRRTPRSRHFSNSRSARNRLRLH